MKKFLSFILILTMVLSVSSVALAGSSTTCLGDSTCAHKAAIGTTHYDTLQEAIDAAVENAVITIIKEGTYVLPSFSQNLTIKAADGIKVTIDNGGAVALSGAKATFENIIFDYYPNVNYTGLQHVGTVEYNKCTINGQVFLYGNKEIFNNCVFNQNSADAYNVWTYGADYVEFNGCTFNCVGKSVLVYNEGAGATDLKVTDTDFNASAPVDGKAAIEIDTTLMPDGTKIVIDDQTTATGFAPGSVSGNTLWNDKKDQDDLEIKVSDSKVWPIAAAKIGSAEYPTLQAAIDAAVNGDTITLLKACAEDVTVEQKADVKFTIDGAGKKMTGIITVNGKSARYPTAGLTIQNFKFDAARVAGIDSDYACINLGKKGDSNTRYTSNVTIMDCTFTDSGSTNRDTAAIKSYTGGDKNLKVIRCSVDDKMHSLLQVAGVEGVVIDGCTANSKNGINLNSSKDVEIKNSTISVSGYAVRMGVDDGGDSGKVTLTNNILKTTDTSGDDAAIILRKSASDKIDLTMEKNVVSGQKHIKGAGADTKISADENYWDGLNGPIVDGEKVPVKNYYTDEELTNLVEFSDKDLQVYPSELNFGSAEYGYDAITAQDMTIINNSDKEIYLAAVESEHYSFDPAIGGKSIAAGKSITVKVAPKTGLSVGTYNATITVAVAEPPASASVAAVAAVTESVNVNLKFEVTAKPRDSIKVKYEGGNSFSTSKSAVPTSVEIDGVPVPFTGNGKLFTVGCIDPDAEWVTVRWNSTSVTVNFKPDVTVSCPVMSIPKTGDMPLWMAVAEFFGF